MTKLLTFDVLERCSSARAS